MNVAIVSINQFSSLPLAAPTLYSYLINKKIDHNIQLKSFKKTTEINEIVEKISHFDIIGFSGHSWSINKIKKICSLLDPRVLTIIGGPYVTFLKDEVIKNKGIDIIVKGEGEDIFYRILSGESLETIPNIIYKKDNKVIENKEDFYFDITKQNYKLIIEDFFYTILYETARGCPFKCSFCCWDISRKNQRFYSLDKVQSDLKEIFKLKKIGHLFFIDSDLFIRKKHGINILHIVDKLNKERMTSGLNEISLSFCLNPQFLNDEVINVINEPRTYHKISCGLQTIHKNSNNLINRKFFNLEKYTHNIQKLDKVKNKLGLELIYGLPGDSLDGFKTTIEYINKNMEVGFINCYKLAKVPGSQFWNNQKKYGLIFDDEPPHTLIESNDFSVEDLEKSKVIADNLERMVSA